MMLSIGASYSLIIERAHSFCLFTAFWGSYLRTSRNLVVRGAIGMLSMWLEILVVIVIAIWVTVSMLWGSVLMHLLRACSILALVTAHGHYTRISMIGREWGNE